MTDIISGANDVQGTLLNLMMFWMTVIYLTHGDYLTQTLRNTHGQKEIHLLPKDLDYIFTGFHVCVFFCG